MAKVTSKLQVTLPKALANQFGIEPGDEIEFVPAGDGIRILTAPERAEPLSVERRLAMFDAATRRQRAREAPTKRSTSKSRGWTREELYTRGRAG
jgi:AbrB family looped-hinge helix DNA binding protein